MSGSTQTQQPLAIYSKVTEYKERLMAQVGSLNDLFWATEHSDIAPLLDMFENSIETMLDELAWDLEHKCIMKPGEACHE